jgi:putative acetyltransferase
VNRRVVPTDPPATIRAERPTDRSAIAEVVTAAFGSSAEAQLVDEIRVSSGFVPGQSLVAEVDGRVVGHVMISDATLDNGHTRRRIANLSPLAVSPEHQRRGIGSDLVRAVTARADEAGEPLVVVEGDPSFYGRFGFEPAARHGIEMTLPSWAPPEAAQVLTLRSYDPSIRGRVLYPPAFDHVVE